MWQYATRKRIIVALQIYRYAQLGDTSFSCLKNKWQYSIFCCTRQNSNYDPKFRYCWNTEVVSMALWLWPFHCGQSLPPSWLLLTTHLIDWYTSWIILHRDHYNVLGVKGIESKKYATKRPMSDGQSYQMWLFGQSLPPSWLLLTTHLIDWYTSWWDENSATNIIIII